MTKKKWFVDFIYSMEAFRFSKCDCNRMDIIPIGTGPIDWLPHFLWIFFFWQWMIHFYLLLFIVWTLFLQFGAWKQKQMIESSWSLILRMERVDVDGERIHGLRFLHSFDSLQSKKIIPVLLSRIQMNLMHKKTSNYYKIIIIIIIAKELIQSVLFNDV